MSEYKYNMDPGKNGFIRILRDDNDDFGILTNPSFVMDPKKSFEGQKVGFSPQEHILDETNFWLKKMTHASK